MRYARLLLLAGCGSFTDGDAASLKDAVRLQAAGLELCADDAGTCNAAQVRALDRSSYCTLAATLARHGQTYPDAGIPCAPRQ